MEASEIREKLDQGSAAAENPRFEQWCLVELFGHSRIAGLVTEASIGGCALLRVDVPSEDGEGVRYTKYFGNGAIYAMTVTDKAVAVRIANNLHPKPPTPRPGEQRALPETSEDRYRDPGPDPDDDDEDEYPV